jgi:hypothetical protein
LKNKKEMKSNHPSPLLIIPNKQATKIMEKKMSEGRLVSAPSVNHQDLKDVNKDNNNGVLASDTLVMTEEVNNKAVAKEVCYNYGLVPELGLLKTRIIAVVVAPCIRLFAFCGALAAWIHGRAEKR